MIFCQQKKKWKEFLIEITSIHNKFIKIRNGKIRSKKEKETIKAEEKKLY